MPRLIRPHISLETRCRVVLRQIGDMWPDAYLQGRRDVAHESYAAILDGLLARLAGNGFLQCPVKELRLDHDPALGARQKVFDKAGNHVDYIPPASDPRYLIYRPHGPQYKGSHLVKTNVRGEHGQHPDRVLIKKNRRLEKRIAETPKKRTAFLIEKPHRRPKKGRRMQGRSQWPTGRKMQSQPWRR